MTPQEYLDNKIKTCSQYSLTDQDKKLLDKDGLEAFLYAKLTSKKFRKWKISPEYSEKIKEQIKFAVDRKQSMTAAWFFGGYKLWRLDSSPEVDWAEFFTLAYFLEYLAPILSVYEHGIKIEFWAAHMSIMRQQSNIPEADCETYRRSLEHLIDQFKKYLPANALIELHTFSEMFKNDSEYTETIKGYILDMEREYREEWSDEGKLNKAASSRLNVMWQGAEDWTGLSDQEKEEKIRRGPIIHDGYCRLPEVNNAIREGGKVDLSATPLPGGSIPIGTTGSSVTKFWTGFGVLEQREDRYVDRILSPQQLEQADKMEYKTESIDLVPLKNFKEIRVYPRFDFSS